MSDSNTTYGGPGFLSLLCILFIGLKLTGYVTWPWVWVLAPIWLPLSLILTLLALWGLIEVFKK